MFLIAPRMHKSKIAIVHAYNNYTNQNDSFCIISYSKSHIRNIIRIKMAKRKSRQKVKLEVEAKFLRPIIESAMQM